MAIQYLRFVRYFFRFLGLYHFLVDSAWKIQHFKSEIKFYRFHPISSYSNQITAVVLTSGESTFFNETLASIKSQSIKSHEIIIIRNVSPFSKAAQAGLDSVKTPFFVTVDDDMILYLDCFKRLIYHISSNNTFAEAVLRLKDPIMGRIYGIHMYRTDVIRSIGFHPLLDEKGAERKLRNMIISLGFSSIYIDVVAGQHHPIYTSSDIFRKYKFIGEQSIYYGSTEGKKIMQAKLDRLCEYWLETQSELTLYAMAGFVAGLTSEDPSVQLTSEDRSTHPLFLKLDEIIKKL